MKTKILAACSIAALAVPFQASAKELPTWSPSAICAADSARDHCEFLEGQARRHIAEQWGFIPALVREQCLKSNADQDSESWRIFGDCLADAARGEQAPAATASGGDSSASAAVPDTAALDAANARIAELEASLAESQTASRRNESRIEGLQQRLTAATAAAAATGAAATAVAMAPSGDAADHEAALGKLEARAKAAEFRSKQLQAALVETIELRKADKAAMASAGDDDAQIATLQANVATGSERITNLQERLIRARENTSAAESSLATSDANLEKANARIRGLQDRMIADRKNAAEATDSRIAELEASLKGAESKVSLGNARIEGLQERLMAAIEEAESAAPAMATGDGAADERIAELETSLASAESQVKLGNARIEGLQARLMEAQDAAPAADTGGADAARLQTLLDNQRERSTRVAAIVSKQRDELNALRGEVRDLRRGAERNVVASCQQRMSDIVSTSGINFGNDSAEITAEAAGVLRRIGAAASLCEDAQITVRGHTDSRGDPIYNQQLSERRARAVARFLGREGVSTARINAVGVGQDEPISSNETRAGRAQNRRIEFLVK